MLQGCSSALSCLKSGSRRRDIAVQRHTTSLNAGVTNQGRSASSAARPLSRSSYLAPVHWDAPNDAVIASHKLLIQAGFIKKVRSL